MNFKSEIKSAEQDISVNNVQSCIFRCGKILEGGLKALLKEQSHGFSPIEKQELLTVEAKIGKDSSPWTSFGLGQLYGLFKQAKIFELLARQLCSNLNRTNKID